VVIECNPEPYQLTGVLIEGIALNIARNFPAEKRAEASVEAVRLLSDRLQAGGTI
jgi:hypothetical protein